jgi:hypothetical protein
MFYHVNVLKGKTSVQYIIQNGCEVPAHLLVYNELVNSCMYDNIGSGKTSPSWVSRFPRNQGQRPGSRSRYFVN